MKCNGVRHLLSAYLDGELDHGEELMVTQHLRRCHACADELDALRQTIALCASLDEVEVPADFRAGLRARLVALGPPEAVAKPRKLPAPVPSWRRNVGRWALPAAAAAAFAIAVGVSPQMADQIVPLSNPPVQEAPAPSAPPGTGGTPQANGDQAVSSNTQGPDSLTGTPEANPAQTGGTSGETTATDPTPPATEVTTTAPPDAPPVVSPNPGGSTVASPEIIRDPEAVAVAPRYAYSSSVKIHVRSVAQAIEELTVLAGESGGSVSTNASAFDPGTRTQSGIIVSLPVGKLDEFLSGLKKLGLTAGGDVARQDYGLQIATLKATIADQQENLEDVSESGSEAARRSLTEQIAQLTEDLEVLEKKVETATVEVILEEIQASLVR